MKQEIELGLSGNLTKSFISSPLTPLMLFAALIIGFIALQSLPREEEPQISVPLVDIHISTNGLKAIDGVKLVTEPFETIIKAIPEVEHVYSNTIDNQVLLTARFYVGTNADAAIARVHEKIRANINRLPKGILDPLVVGRGIDDVAIVTLTLTPKPEALERWSDNQLHSIANDLLVEVAKLPDVGLSYLVGGRKDQIRIEPNPERLSLHGVTLDLLIGKLSAANRSFMAGRIRNNNKSLPVLAGQTLSNIKDIGLLLLTTREGKPVYVRDVADIIVGAEPAKSYVWHYNGKAAALHQDGEGADKTAHKTSDNDKDYSLVKQPAVSIAIAKRAGANAVDISRKILQQVERMKGRLIPNEVEVIVTRNYGETANEKANELLFHLGLATVSIVLLVGLVIGWREGAVVMVVIPTTILLTMFASYLMGYTINRVSLFALIFSIGILVDDAIVVIENIARHWGMDDDRTRKEAAIEAVAEVGNPTVIATMTVVAALLPMLFVSGLMGPYMSPIPANASAAMIFSFFVAMILTPWLMIRFASKTGGGHVEAEDGGVLGRLYMMVAKPILRSRLVSLVFLLLVGLATLASVFMFYNKMVTVKLLPFDNKSEFQIVVDLPEGSTMEETDRILSLAADRLKNIPELLSIQSYAGTASPFNFNGLVRHYYLRNAPEMGDLQINLTAKHHRSRTSHQIALEARKLLKDIKTSKGTSVKVVEVPPGPPVMATLLAEIYGPDAKTRRAVTNELRGIFEKIPFIVDTDDSFGTPSTRLRFSIDQNNLEFHRVAETDVYNTVEAYLHGVTIGYSHKGEGRRPVEIAVQMPHKDLSLSERTLTTPIPSGRMEPAGPNNPNMNRMVIELGDLVTLKKEKSSYPIFRHNSRNAEMLMAELAGSYEAPVYGMIEVAKAIDKHDWKDLPKPVIAYYGQPEDESKTTLLWDGEWEVTYVTFRDMGAAFIVALLAIYFLVVVQFGSFKLPLVILTPVPLTLIGIMYGHWLFSAPFSATSMIGFIALAGIIVRNSILLVDFILHTKSDDKSLRDVLLEAGAVRFKPILLTAVAAMIGAVVILADPIFQGLAISMLFGLMSSTLLTVLIIPAIYIVLRDDKRPFNYKPEPTPQPENTPEAS